jgi:hypothetical protein
VAIDQQLGLWAGYVGPEDERGTLSVRNDQAYGGGSYIVGSDRPR